MGNVDMGSGKGKNKKERMNRKQQRAVVAKDKQVPVKMIYLGLPTALTFITELYDTPVADKYAEAMVQTLTQQFQLSEIKQMILDLFRFTTPVKFMENAPKQYEILTRVFTERVWE